VGKYIVKKGEHREGGKVYQEGETVTSDVELDKVFKEKFIKAGAKTQEPASEPRKAMRSAVLEDDEEEKPAREVPADEDAGEETTSDKEKSPKKSPKKSDTPKKAKDVTGKFKAASDNDYKVTHSAEEGYQVMDGDKVVNQKPLKTKSKVDAFLQEHLKGDKD
jgi:hypothetical protein